MHTFGVWAVFHLSGMYFLTSPKSMAPGKVQLSQRKRGVSLKLETYMPDDHNNYTELVYK